jgi:TRAP-type mannitol/chloroaromatic compound transport system substrate-binding protein
MRRLGVAVVMTPPGEITTAMLSGTVDAAEWVGPWNDIAFGLHKAAKYYYMPAFHEPGSGLEVIINKDRYAALPDDLKEIIKRAAQATTAEATADFTAHNIQAFQKLPEYGVEKRTWSDEISAALASTSRTVLEELAASDAMAGKVYASYNAYVKECVAYQAYFDRRMLEMREAAFS